MNGNGMKMNEPLRQSGDKVEAGPTWGRRGGIIEFIKFGLVGVMNTAVDFLVFTLLIWAGAHYLAAHPVSYTAGTLNSYAVNKFWTFKRQGSSIRSGSKAKAAGTEFLRFLALNGGTLLLSVVLLYVFKDGLGMSPMLAKLAVTGFTVSANYAGSKLWVFR